MGDRANFGFKQHTGDTIYLYGHWAGDKMMGRLAHSLAHAKPRWSDEAYGTRMCISYMTANATFDETGWGISVNYLCDNEHSIPIVDWESQTVSLYNADWDTETNFPHGQPKFTMDFDSFVNKFAK